MSFFDDKISKRARDIDKDGEPDSGAEYAIWIVGALVLVVLTFWLAFWTSSLVHGFDPLPASAVKKLPEGMIGVIQHPFDPASGWAQDPVLNNDGIPVKPQPERWQSMIAPWWLFWPLLALIVWGEIRLVRSGWQLFERLREPERRGAQWAKDRDLKEIMDPEPPLWRTLGARIGVLKPVQPPRGLVMGLTEDSRRVLRLNEQNHGVVVAGTRSGKTAGLCIPAVLTYDGTIIATSVKDDMVKDTIEERRKKGPVFVYDPSRSMDLADDEICYWSPLDVAKDWEEALKIAETLLTISLKQGGDGGGSNMQFFLNMSMKCLPVLLYAAAAMDEDMRRVIKWINLVADPQTHAEVDSILRWKRANDALDMWVSFLGREAKLRGDIGATVEAALVVFNSPKVQATAITHKSEENPEGPAGLVLSPEALFGIQKKWNPKTNKWDISPYGDGRPATLYVVAPPTEQERLAPVLIALLQGLLNWVTDLPIRELPIPTLAVLDEAANIASMPQLPGILSRIGSKRVSILTAWQDFAQIEKAYGKEWTTILNNSRMKLILAGVTDTTTLNFFKEIGGEQVIESVSVSRQERDAQSRNVSIGEQNKPLLDVVTLVQQDMGKGILVYGNLRAARIKLRMYFLDGELRESVGMGPVPEAFFVDNDLRSKVGLPPQSRLNRLLRKTPVIGKSLVGLND